MAPKDVDLARIAAQHHGIFTIHHARAVGFSDDEVRRRRESGAWISLHKAAFRVAGAPQLWRGDLLAACWAGGFRAYASHRSAAALWRLAGGRRNLIEVTCPRWRRARHDGLVVHETKADARIDVVDRDGIPVTTPSRTLLDLGAVCGRRTVELAFESALHRDLVTLADLDDILRRFGRSGRNGAGFLRSIVRMRNPRAAPTESAMETRIIQVLREHGLPEPQRQVVIRSAGRFVARVDLAYPQWQIATEYDSYEWHLGANALVRDAVRRNAVTAAGWTPISATVSDVRDGGSQLCGAIFEVARRFGVGRGV